MAEVDVPGGDGPGAPPGGLSLAERGAPPGRSPLFDARWHYIENPKIAELTADERRTLEGQRAEYYPRRQADAVLDLLLATRHDPTFGYRLNSYHHSLQSATQVYRAGYPEEDVVVAVLHDIGFHACPERHGALAAELLGAYISERNYWMLAHHQFVDGPEWKRWQSHPYAGWTETFFEHFDIDAMDPDYDNLPLEFFEPMVRRTFHWPSRQPNLPA